MLQDTTMLYEQSDSYDAYSVGDKRPFAHFGEQDARETRKRCIEPTVLEVFPEQAELLPVDSHSQQIQGHSDLPTDVVCMLDGKQDLFGPANHFTEGTDGCASETYSHQQCGRDSQTVTDDNNDNFTCNASNHNQLTSPGFFSPPPLNGHCTISEPQTNLFDYPSVPPVISDSYTSNSEESSQHALPSTSEQFLSSQTRTPHFLPQPSSTVDQSTTGDCVAEVSPPRLEIHGAQSKVCFGALIDTVKLSNAQQADFTHSSIELRGSGDLLTLHCKDTGKYMGLLTNETLGVLLRKYEVTFTAALGPCEETQKKNVTKTKAATNERKSYRIRIVIYGRSNQKDDIASTLSDAGLYLQHPSVDEIDRDVVYDNPQYLIRPGSQMPLLDMFTGLSTAQNNITTDNLSETRKNYLMRIFDSVGGTCVTPSMSPSLRLSTRLKEHQQMALEFMCEKESGLLAEPKFPPLWKRTENTTTQQKYCHAVTGTYENAPSFTRGGILADEMGLGKSLSLLALICSGLDAASDDLYSTSDQEHRSYTTLIVTPKSTIPGWQKQIKDHIHTGCLRVQLYHGQQRHLSHGFDGNDIVITTYETLRSEWEKQGSLVTQSWYRVVLDEAHHIRNRTSKLFGAACALRSQYRWCLTGTPIHNSLDDFGALISFIGVQPFMSKLKFDYWISTAMKKNNSRSLDRLLEGTCRLPERSETVEYVDLSPADRDLYEFFRAHTAKVASAGAKADMSSVGTTQQQTQLKIITLINTLRLICNHGEMLLPAAATELWKNQNSTTTSWRHMRTNNIPCQMCGAEADESDLRIKPDLKTPINSFICSDCASEGSASMEDILSTSPCPGPDFLPSSSLELSAAPVQSNSAKIQALLRSLSNIQSDSDATEYQRPNKSVVFSVWTKMLDLIQQALQTHGYIFQRIDGKSSLEARKSAISIFNDDPNCTIMLASIGSTGEGVDLKVANTVHIIEPHWNPMVEAQAVDRVHRIGQDRDVNVIRYVVRNSIESYVRWLQLDKIKLVNKSVDAAGSQQQQEINDARWNKLRDALKNP